VFLIGLSDLITKLIFCGFLLYIFYIERLFILFIVTIIIDFHRIEDFENNIPAIVQSFSYNVGVKAHMLLAEGKLTKG
jgi:hypothetical protein